MTECAGRPGKDRETLRRQMARRGCTWKQIGEAVAEERRVPDRNNETGAPATRYIHPATGRSVAIDHETGEVIHVGGDGYLY